MCTISSPSSLLFRLWMSCWYSLQTASRINCTRTSRWPACSLSIRRCRSSTAKPDYMRYFHFNKVSAHIVKNCSQGNIWPSFYDFTSKYIQFFSFIFFSSLIWLFILNKMKSQVSTFYREKFFIWCLDCFPCFCRRLRSRGSGLKSSSHSAKSSSPSLLQ